MSHPDDNPLVDHLLVRQPVPDGCIAPVLVYSVGLFGLASQIWAILSLETRFVRRLETEALLAFCFYLLWPVLLMAPLVASAAGALLTARTRRQDAFALIAVSGLSNRAIVTGLLVGSAYWLRGWMSMLLGLTPMLIGATIYLNGRVESGLLGQGPVPVLVTIGVWGVNALALALGVTLALRWRGWIVAALIAFTGTGIFGMGLLAVILFPTPVAAQAGSAISWVLLALVASGGPYAMAFGVIRLAQGWVRR